MASAPSRRQVARTAWRHGPLLCSALWVVGAAAIAAIAAELLPGGLFAAAAILLGLAITIAVGVTSQRCGFFAAPINRLRTSGSHLALTFDDGPHPEFTPRILETLRRRGHRATFFVVGERVRAHPELVRRIVQEGHEIGNHSLRHAWHMALWPTSRFTADLSETNHIIERTAGVTPTLFRPPAAILSPRVARGTRGAGLRLVGFSARAADGAVRTTPDQALARLLAGMKPGAILLLHDGPVAGRASVALQILPELLEAMERQGVRGVRLSELLAGCDSGGESPEAAEDLAGTPAKPEP
jgi:peptidoglycan/xylan/chitin deacetylase (PgdA/CDA1 family)